MATVLEALQKVLSTNDTSKYFLEQVFSELDSEHRARIQHVLSNCLRPYAHIPNFQKAGNIEMVRMVVEHFPTFILRFCDELAKEPQYLASAQSLQLAGISALVLKESSFSTAIQSFMQVCPKKASLKDLNQRLTTSPSEGYFPAFLHRDIEAYQGLTFQSETTKKLKNLVEIFFIFEGTSLLYLKFFLNLLRHAPSHEVIEHVEYIFSKLFVTLRLQEAMYWKKYGHHNQLKEQLAAIIEKDSPKQRHPILRKSFARGLILFNPFSQATKAALPVEQGDSMVAKQFSMLLTLDIQKLAFFLKELLLLKGPHSAAFVLNRLKALDGEKLQEIQLFLRENKTPTWKELRELLQSFTTPKKPISNPTDMGNSSVSQGGTVLYTAATVARMVARKKLAANKDVKKLSADQVADYLADRLRKLYQRVRIEGALTNDKIPEYLANLSRMAERIICAPQVTLEEVNEVAASASEMLQGIAEEGNLSGEQFESALQDIHETTQKLQTDDVEERANLIEKIGETIAEAATVQEDVGFDEFITQELIPMGLEENAPCIAVQEFLRLPLGNQGTDMADDWFDYHLRYLSIALEQERIEQSVVDRIQENLDQFQQYKYKKYFNIFPNHQFDDTILMAVFSMWQNKALNSLIIDA